MRYVNAFLAGVLVVLIGGAPAGAVVILPGWDLLETLPGTSFMGQPFQGVPIGTYDFGGTIGPKAVGTTDTIVQRLGTASVLLPPGADTIPIELVALNLVSVNPIDLGAGLNFYYVTLQSERGGPASPGQMTVHVADANGGTFDSFFDVFFDIRLGALNGPIVFSDHLPLVSQGTPWDRTPPPEAVVIDGVNHLLNGTDQMGDFWPDIITEIHPGGLAIHRAGPAVIPEPAAIAIWTLLSGLGLAVARWRVRRT